MTSALDASARSGVSPARVVAGVGIPLLVTAAAFGLWWLSDRLLYVGPLDRATFGWVVVVPLWLATPIASALAWRQFSARGMRIAATTLGLIVGGAAALLLWEAAAHPNCQYGASSGPEAWILPALILGAVIGGGLAASSLVASRRLATGRILGSLVAGAATQACFMAIAILAFTSFALTTSQCQRPI